MCIRDRFKAYRKGNVGILNAPGTGFADDKLIYHEKIRNSDWDGHVITAISPDSVMNINS